jgi:hypothetical protein
MFCGECGRAVGTRAAQAVHPDSGMPLQARADEGARRSAPQHRDTVILEPLADSFPELSSELATLSAADKASEPPTVAPAPAAPTPVAPAPVDPGVEQDLSPEVVEEDIAAPEQRAPSEPSELLDPSDAPAIVRPDPFPWGDRGSAIFTDSDEIEQTLIVARRETGARFVLQFSTGESVTVHGSGLLGRNPVPQPTEYFDQLVTITDPGKSVSKTHLEFGQEAGAFWVSDRFSGNGSVVREPESAPRRLVPGKRYRIVRGTRVDIGEQFFVVS